MTNAAWDTIVVGQGLAGATLAWHLQECGERVLVIDSQEPVTSSKIAAGLITPVTGQQLGFDPHYDEYLAAARSFYTRIEARTGRSFFHDRMAVRLFRFDKERRLWPKRVGDPSIRRHLADPVPVPLIDPGFADSSGGGFAMRSAQLDTPSYLAASRAAMHVSAMTLDWRRDVLFERDAVMAGGFRARRIVSCEGCRAAQNPFFTRPAFNPAKGDILTLRFDSPLPPLCVHRGVWLAPTDDPQIFRAGSTYDREKLDQIPDASARAKIEGGLRAFIRAPWKVLDHTAAVRPIIRQSKPVAGLHPEEDRLGFFNGLGSKGALLAPWHARRFAEFLTRGAPLPEAVDLRNRL